MGYLKLERFFVLSSPGQLETLSLSYLLKEKDTKCLTIKHFKLQKVFFFLDKNFGNK